MPNGSWRAHWRVSIHHPLGFIWHPTGSCWYKYPYLSRSICVYLRCMIGGFCHYIRSSRDNQNLKYLQVGPGWLIFPKVPPSSPGIRPASRPVLPPWTLPLDTFRLIGWHLQAYWALKTKLNWWPQDFRVPSTVCFLQISKGGVRIGYRTAIKTSTVRGVFDMMRTCDKQLFPWSRFCSKERTP